MTSNTNEYNIINDDCINGLKTLPEQSVNLILTDPPYNLGKFMKERATNLKQLRPNYFGAAGWDDLGFDEWQQSMDTLFEEAGRVIVSGGSMIVFMSIIKVETLIRLAQNHGFYYKTTGIWHKKNPMPRNMNLHFINSTEAWVYFTYNKRTGTFNNNGKAVHDFFETGLTPKAEGEYGRHPTQKPVSLLEQMILLLSNEGDVVLDPFMGSGSTGVAALKNNRKFVGIELNKDYFEICSKRLKDTINNDTQTD